MKQLLTLALCALGALSLAGCSPDQTTQSKSAKELVVGMELAYPPFEGKDFAGNPAGISPDFFADYAKETGRVVRIENISFDGLIPALVTGRVDAVMSSMTATAERAKTVDFTEPYAHAKLAVLTTAARPVKSLEDLNRPDRTIAAKIGSTGYIFAQTHLPQAKITGLADESACVMEVASGKADGFIYDQMTIYRNWQANPETTATLFLPNADIEPWAIAVKKGNTQLADSLNAFIATYRKNGGFDKLSERYLSEEMQAFRKLGFLWFFDDPKGH